MKINYIFRWLYYFFVPAVYFSFFGVASLCLKKAGRGSNVGAMLPVTYAVLLVGIWILIGVLMRFSLLKWYLDPFAALEAPALMYTWMVVSSLKECGEWKTAFQMINRELGDDGGMGWLFLVGLFSFGLVFSFSIARKKGQSISFRILSKLFPEKAAKE